MSQGRIRWALFPLVLAVALLSACATGVLVGGGKGGESTVRYPSQSDARITAEVNRRLVAEPIISAMDVTVETRNGIVTLYGVLPNRAAVDKAAAITARVPGVQGVRNHLQIAR